MTVGTKVERLWQLICQVVGLQERLHLRQQACVGKHMHSVTAQSSGALCVGLFLSAYWGMAFTQWVVWCGDWSRRL